MATQRNPTLSDTTELTSGANKFITLDGMKFQSDWRYDNSLVLDCNCPTPNFASASHWQTTLSIWEAIMVLPFVQGSNTVPAYLATLTGGALQQGDLADRVLWKRITTLRIYGQNALPGTSIAWIDESSDRQGHGPVVVKTKARLDDRHGLFMVRNFVHDIFYPFSPRGIGGCGLIDCDACTAGACLNQLPTCGSVPIFNDFWAKLFYHAR